MQIQSLQLSTGYICRICNGTFCGQYVFLKGEMFVRGDCSCSFWLVKSTEMNHIFKFFREV